MQVNIRSLGDQTHTGYDSRSGANIYRSSRHSNQAALPSPSLYGSDLELRVCHIACESIYFNSDAAIKIDLVQADDGRDNRGCYLLTCGIYTQTLRMNTKSDTQLGWILN
jgi:hypothetical protein